MRDDEVRAQIARRATGAHPDETALQAAIGSRIDGERYPRAWSLRLPRWATVGGLAGLVAVAALVATIAPGITGPVGPSAAPTSNVADPLLRALTAEEFRRVVAAASSDASLVGRTVIADGSFARHLGSFCSADEACPVASIEGVAAFADSRVENAPDPIGPFAVRLRSDGAVDLLGPVRVASGDRIGWKLDTFVEALAARPLTDRLAPDVYLVDTSLMADIGLRCPPDADHPFGCFAGVAWLGTSPLTKSAAGVSAPLGGLRVQGDAYRRVAPDPANPSTPQRGVFLVRPLVTQPVGCFLCPPAGAVELLARVDPIIVPAATPRPTDQPQGGNGWRLLGEAAAGEPYTVRYATDPAGLAALWSVLGLGGEPPAVDFEREIAVLFGATVSGSCPEIRFDGVGVDRAGGVVHGRFGYPMEELPGSTARGCTADARPHGFLVAVARDILPPSPFTLRLYRYWACADGCEGEEVRVDLGGARTSSPAPSVLALLPELAGAEPDSDIADEARLRSAVEAARAALAALPIEQQTRLVVAQVNRSEQAGSAAQTTRVTFHDAGTGAVVAVDLASIGEGWEVVTAGVVNEAIVLSAWERDRVDAAVRSAPDVRAALPDVFTVQALGAGPCEKHAGLCVRSRVTGGDPTGKDTALDVSVELLSRAAVSLAPPPAGTPAPAGPVDFSVTRDDPAWTGSQPHGRRANLCFGACLPVDSSYPGLAPPIVDFGPQPQRRGVSLRLVRATIESVTWDGVTMVVTVRDRPAGFQELAIQSMGSYSFQWRVVTTAGETLLNGGVIID